MSARRPRCECGSIAKVEVKLVSRGSKDDSGWFAVCNPCRWWAYAQATRYKASFHVRTFEQAKEGAAS